MNNLSDWQLIPLSNLGSWKGGGTPSKNNSSFWNGNIPWVSPKDFISSAISDTEDHITQEAINNSSTTIIKKNSILIVVRSGILRNYVPIAINRVDLAINQDLKALIVNDKFDVNYVFQTLSAFNKRIKNDTVKVGTTVESIDFNALKKLCIPIPPLPEQRKIAEILSTWDEAIAKTAQLVEALRYRKKGLMQRLFTGQVRFPGFEEEWKYKKLGELFYERVERGYDQLPLLSVSENGISYRDASNRKDNSSEDKSKYLRICPGDIGYNTMRMWQGRSAVSPYEGIVSPAYTILVPKEGVDVRFMSYLFKFKPMIHTFFRYSQGLVSDTWSLKYPNFAKIHVRIPVFEEQKKIAHLLDLCDIEINEMQSYTEKLQIQKKGLMQRLLTGNLRINL
jgi:type I restriction enzyme S subunit